MTTQPPAEETTQLPIAQQLNDAGAKYSIPRKTGETDADYAERMVYLLDERVEELWAHQDSIRELIPPAESE